MITTYRYSIHFGHSSKTNLTNLTQTLKGANRSAKAISKNDPETPVSIFDNYGNRVVQYLGGEKVTHV
jgi:hypothetical protein